MIDLTSHAALTRCLVKDPIKLPSTTTLAQATKVMADENRLCDVNDQDKGQLGSNKSSCILVMEGDRLIGIVTERDLLQLVLEEKNWERMTLGAVMSSPVITVDLEDNLNPVTISQTLQKHGVRHLPVLHPAGYIYGVVTHRLIRHTIEAAHLLRLRFVKEVMVESVIRSEKTDSLWTLAQLMVEHNIGSIVIVEPHPKLENEAIASGLITEQDILQFRALGLDLRQVTAAEAISEAPKSIRTTDSLIQAKEVMQETQSDRLIVTGRRGEMLGLITQSNLLEAMNHNEMFKLINFLEQQIEERTDELDRINLKLREEVEERRKAERRIRRLTLIDELTGLYNRRGFFFLAEQELKLTQERALPFSVFFIDVDHLKTINDRFGHETGDQVIIDTAQQLRACFRRSDIIARLGGDEFTCFALTNSTEAALVVQRLEEALTKFNQRQKRPFTLSLSIGYVSYDEPREVSLRESIKQADENMYQNKARKRKAMDDD